MDITFVPMARDHPIGVNCVGEIPAEATNRNQSKTVGRTLYTRSMVSEPRIAVKIKGPMQTVAEFECRLVDDILKVNNIGSWIYR